jgi:hypothetical protein
VQQSSIQAFFTARPYQTIALSSKHLLGMMQPATRHGIVLGTGAALSCGHFKDKALGLRKN